MVTGTLADADYLPFVDSSETNSKNKNKKITAEGIKDYLQLWYVPTQTVTTDYTVTIDDHTIYIDATSNDVTITLLDATTCGGKEFEFLRKDSSANASEVHTDGSQTINGAAFFNMPSQYDTLRIKSDGTNWYIF